MSRLHTDPLRVPSTSGRQPHNQTTGNWAGYIANGSTYNTVSASWVQPTVQCNVSGAVVFWVGLDGAGSSTVEQTGTGVDCSSGQPQYFAWWETYPENAIQTYGDSVNPGDSMSASATDNGDGTYQLVLTDNSQGWSENHAVAAPQGASDASAEVVVEAPSTSAGEEALPDFGTVNFTGSQVDGSDIAAAGGQPYDMAPNGSVDAATGADDGNGDFPVTWQGSN